MTKNILALLVLILSSVTGCAFQTAEETDDMGTLNFQAEQWGQRRVVRGSELQENQPQVVLQNDGSNMIPHVRTVMLSVQPSDTPTQANNILRWKIDAGVGGGSSTIYIDALGTQQISLPSSKVTISLVATKLDTAADFVAPDVDYTASAYVAIGNTSTPTAHYTTAASIGASSGTNLLIPAGATGFRLCGVDPGDNPTTSPFTATMHYDVFTSQFQDQYRGDDLFTLHDSEGFIPLPGGARNMSISNGNAGTTTPIIVWQIDM